MATIQRRSASATKPYNSVPGFTGAHRIYIASLAQAGRSEEARTALDRLKELQPEISITWVQQNSPYMPGPMGKLLEGMRKAGLQ